MATVMVVDDTAVIRETVAKLLRQEGYKTVCAANGKEALAVFRDMTPDLVLLDVMMPEMNGMEFLQSLRQHPRGRALPVIMMTALSDDANQTLAEELGASDYLVKARFNVAEILDRVRLWIGDQPPDEPPRHN
jgi:DNA-binding response OmpR family regulator